MDKPWHRNFFSFLHKPAVIVPTSADRTDPEVQFDLGAKLACGRGVAPDYAQAAEWYRKAAAQNHSLAQFNLGIMYARGQGVAPDAVESLMWFGKAAQLGDAGAQYKLGEHCQRASFKQLPAAAAESRIEAYKWYRLAAAQGYDKSETAYATLTLNMNRTDVATGNKRVAAFQIEKPQLPQG